MAYSNHTAYVFNNNRRREDKEDTLLFESIKDSKICHGILGDSDKIRIGIYMDRIPGIYILSKNKKHVKRISDDVLARILKHSNIDYYSIRDNIERYKNKTISFKCFNNRYEIKYAPFAISAILKPYALFEITDLKTNNNWRCQYGLTQPLMY